MTFQLIGKIEEIQETKSYPKKDGSGELYVTKLKINGKYFTCFYAPEFIKDMKIGDEVEVIYTPKENVYEGKKYTNYNINIINPITSEKIMSLPSADNIVTIGDKKYKLTFTEI